jgi:hypothetical protein
MDLDLSDVIESWAKPVLLERRAAPTMSAGGIATPGAATTIPITMVVQPLSDRQMAALSEGLRESARYAGFTRADVHTFDHATKTPADRVTYKGHVYAIGQVGDWDESGRYREVVLVDETAAGRT